MKKFKNCIQRSFPKIRITNKLKKGPEYELLKEKEILNDKLKNDILDANEKKKVIENIDDIEHEISEICAERNKSIIKHQIIKLSDTENGFNAPNMWSIR